VVLVPLFCFFAIRSIGAEWFYFQEPQKLGKCGLVCDEAKKEPPLSALNEEIAESRQPSCFYVTLLLSALVANKA
jgi:hypothetical protein